MRSAAVRGMLDIMQREDFRTAVSALPGYEGTDTGQQLTLDEAVPVS